MAAVEVMISAFCRRVLSAVTGCSQSPQRIVYLASVAVRTVHFPCVQRRRKRKLVHAAAVVVLEAQAANRGIVKPLAF